MFFVYSLGMEKKTQLEDMGFDAFFEDYRRQFGLAEMSVARVIAEHRGAYKVKSEVGEYVAKVTGNKMFNASSREDFPAVGDWVAIDELNDKQAVIRGVLPRRTLIERKHGDKDREGGKDRTQIIATNVDYAFVVEAVDRDYSLNRFERYFALLEGGGVQPVIVLNKIDLISDEDLQDRIIEIEDRFPGVGIITSSTVSAIGIEGLRRFIVKGKTYCFLGSSGVGKSSLINALIGNQDIKTGEISSYFGKGKHTTTGRQLYFLHGGGAVIDNPGMREVGVESVQALQDSYDQLSELARDCKYSDCTHTHEPGCAVASAVESGELNKEKFENFVNLEKEDKHYEMDDYERRRKGKSFSKIVRSAKKEFRQRGHKGY